MFFYFNSILILSSECNQNKIVHRKNNVVWICIQNVKKKKLQNTNITIPVEHNNTSKFTLCYANTHKTKKNREKNI